MAEQEQLTVLAVPKSINYYISPLPRIHPTLRYSECGMNADLAKFANVPKNLQDGFVS